ncbi:MAG TPA: hypothetical protein VHO02_07795 [Fibrobacteria bacterium]|jgi:hypothetical protein|nr:hypothetical protein [Fibrobacteria bacterium]
MNGNPPFPQARNPKYRRVGVLASTFAAAIFASCAPSAKLTVIDPVMRSPNPGSVDVFLDAGSIPYAYKEIAVIVVEDGSKRPASELLEAAVEKARSVGAEGVLVLARERKFGGYVRVQGETVPISLRVLRVSAIVATGGFKP